MQVSPKAREGGRGAAEVLASHLISLLLLVLVLVVLLKRAALVLPIKGQAGLALALGLFTTLRRHVDLIDDHAAVGGGHGSLLRVADALAPRRNRSRRRLHALGQALA